jgi:hypothetical protein
MDMRRLVGQNVSQLICVRIIDRHELHTGIHLLTPYIETHSIGHAAVEAERGLGLPHVFDTEWWLG